MSSVRRKLNHQCFSHFRGYQKQLPRVPLHERTVLHQGEDRRTVQGAIEEALARLRPRNEVTLNGSSRSAAGLHI